MRVLPVVTRGPFENVNDLLYLHGIDTAIVYGDALEYFKKSPSMAGIERRPGVHYSVLTPNMKGFEAAVGSKPDEIVVFGTTSRNRSFITSSVDATSNA